jgi:archaellum biogenesis ATPase FlaH
METINSGKGNPVGEIEKWALQYANRASVIPVGKDKKPLIAWKEFQERRATEAEIKEWFVKWPEANIGIVTGKISNIAVVDIEKGGDVSELPKTVIAKTGGGGWHYYYQFQEGIENKARTRELTDIRGEGGYVVAPPSVHASGQKYEWISQGNIQPFPKHLFGIKAQADWSEVAKGASVGQRNETAAKYIGKLMSVFSPDTWENTVWETVRIWNERNTPPMPERELRITYDSISRKAIRNDREEEIEPDEIKIVHISETESLFVSDDKYETRVPMIDDNIGGGIEEGDLIVISAPTGFGKTTMMQTLTKNLASQFLPSLWFSFEVLMKHLWQNFQDMGLTKDDVVFAPFKNISGSVDFIEKAIQKAKQEREVKFVFVDHLGFLVPRLSKNDISKNYSAYLGQVCRELKELAINERVVIFLAAHMRKTENPTVNDIRDSAGIAQEADLVFTLNREIIDSDADYYGDRTQLTIVKNRKTGKTARKWFVLENRTFVESTTQPLTPKI